jgi:hypothetical protein
LPLASTTAWILVVRPPRERPMHRAAGMSAAVELKASSAAPLYLAIAGHEAVGKPIGGREPAAP